MDQTVDGGRGCHRVLEDALPVAEHQIAGNQHRAPFVAFGDQREQDLGFFRALFDVANVVQDQKLERIESAQLLRQQQIALGGEQLLNQLIRRTECPCSMSASPIAQAAWLLPTPGRPKASAFSARSRNSPRASSRSFRISGAGSVLASRASKGLPGGSCAARRRLVILRCSPPSASISSTSMTSSSASRWPA